MKDWIRELAIEKEEIVHLRRYLHAHPELSGFETGTLAYIASKLESTGIPYVEVEKGGILAFISGGLSEESSGRTVLLRADMDALPIEENCHNLTGEKTVVSQRPGVAHMCGHDAHTAMLLGAASSLNRLKDRLAGNVILCFERAEETGGPDESYGREPLFAYLEKNKIAVDTVFAIHVRPSLASGRISAEDGGVFAGGFGFRIILHGSGGHGSRPDLAVSPLDCFTAFYQSVQDIRMKELDPFEPFTFSIPVVHMGDAPNVIPDTLQFEGTARSLDVVSLNRFKEAFYQRLDAVCGMYGCRSEIQLSYLSPPLINRREDAKLLRTAIMEELGPEYYQACPPTMGSESFAHYTDSFGGALAFLGIANEKLGTGAPLHTPEFDIDEEALPLGTAAYVLFALKQLTVK